MQSEGFLNGAVELFHGDSRDVLKSLPDNSVDSVNTDPPYALVSIVQRFGAEGAAPTRDGDVYARSSAGFMGQSWDTGETAFAEEFWREVMRVLKPGGHLIAFSGTRTYHRLACAIEDAGFELRDMLQWLYGTGFPKSHDVSKGIDQVLGVERPVIGTETLSNDIRGGGLLDVSHGEDRPALVRNITAPGSAEAAAWEGWGTALKPALEPIVLARKPLGEKSVARNVLKWGTGALNIEACRIPAEKPTGWGGAAAGGNTWNGENCGLAKEGDARPVDGRWPANVLHDGSAEVVALLGEAARFFYSAKADALDRAGSGHPTVKRLDLMQWLARLTTPPGGVILDPFAGSGTTGEAAAREGFRCILIEREANYCADIRERLTIAASGGEMAKRRAIAKRKAASNDTGPGALFA